MMNLQLSDFTLKGELGRGSYGVVFKARSRHDGGIYVLKQVPMSNAKVEREAMKEVQMLKQLAHTNIIKYYGSFVEKANLYIVMEYAEGGDLHQLVMEHKHKRRPFQEREIWRYASELVSAISYLHDHGILHRDIKTMNVLLTKHHHVRLADLGASKRAKDLALHRTHIGTPLFLAPELVLRTQYDFKVDVWALGCVLYQLATFQLPFQGENIIALGNAIVRSQPKPLPTCYSEQLGRFIYKLLEKNPGIRPAISEVRKMISEQKGAKDASVGLIEDLATEFTLMRSLREEPSPISIPKIPLTRPEPVPNICIETPKQPLIPEKSVRVQTAMGSNRRSQSITRCKPTVKCLLEKSVAVDAAPKTNSDIPHIEKEAVPRPSTSIGGVRAVLPTLAQRSAFQDPRSITPIRTPVRPTTCLHEEGLFHPPKLSHLLQTTGHLRVSSHSQTPVTKKKLGIANLIS